MMKAYDIDIGASEMSQLYAPAWYPALTIPAGYGEDGQPQNVIFVGPFLSEVQLLAVGYASGEATNARVVPNLDATIEALNI